MVTAGRTCWCAAGLQPPISSVTGGVGTNFVATADLNHDGKLDLVMASGGSVNVRLGRGDGTFQKPLNYPAGGASCIAIADFNGDGIPDLAVNSSANVLGIFPGQILLGNGDGTFRTPPTYLRAFSRLSPAISTTTARWILQLVCLAGLESCWGMATALSGHLR
jgi:FG-GAP-like repeat